MAGVEKGGIVVECISARLMKVRIQLEGKPNGVSFVVGYALTLGSLVREKNIPEFRMHLTAWSRGFPVGTAFLSSWIRILGRANDNAGVPTVRC